MSSNNYSVLFVSHYTDLYGANRSMLNLIDGLKQTGLNNIKVIVPHKGEVCNKLAELNIACEIIPFVLEVCKQHQPYLKKIAKKYYNLLLAKKYKRRFSKNENLIIHTNASVTFFGAYLAHYLQAPHVWHIREFGKADYNLEYNFGDAYFLKWANKAATVICISKVLCNHRFNNNTKIPLKVIYNGIAHRDSIKDNITSSSQKNKRFRFGISGNISAEKNQEEAIEAFNLMHKDYDCELLIAGTGENNFINLLKQKIEKYNLTQSVLFKGFVDDIPAFNSTLDCMLMCAKNEALGRVTIEAMSEGLPVIGFNNAGTAEIIEDGCNGFLYNNGAKELAEKMKFVIDSYEALTAIRNRALQTVKKNYTIESCTEKVCEVYGFALENIAGSINANR